MRAMLDWVAGRLVDHVASLPDQPACGDVEAEDLCRALREPEPPTAGAPLDELLEPYFDEWVGRSFNTAGPGYFAFIPGGGLFAAALAELVSSVTNRFTGVWRAAPVLAQLEANALDWLRSWMTFPPGTRGVLTTGGSMANLIALVCARERHLGTEIRPGVVYASEHVHHSVGKAARLAGVAPDRVRPVAVDGDFRMRVDALADAIARDRRAGLVPFCVVSSAGTTNTGAVDPLDAIADLCADESLWHHCDGAYGAFFHAVPALRGLLPGLARADSLTLDPHKGLFLPYGTGALLVRDGEALRSSFGASASYLPDAPDADAFYDPSQHGPELSRDHRGLRLWLAIKLYGAQALVDAIAEKRALAFDAAARIGAIDGIEIVAPPQLSLFAFALRPPDADPARADAATRELVRRVTARGRVMITGCRVDGRDLARVCVLSFRTHAEHVDACVEDCAAVAAELLAGHGAPAGGPAPRIFPDRDPGCRAS